MRGAFVPGKLQAYLDAQYAPLSDVIQACVVRHSDQLVSDQTENSPRVNMIFSLFSRQMQSNDSWFNAGMRTRNAPTHAMHL